MNVFIGYESKICYYNLEKTVAIIHKVYQMEVGYEKILFSN